MPKKAKTSVVVAGTLAVIAGLTQVEMPTTIEPVAGSEYVFVNTLSDVPIMNTVMVDSMVLEPILPADPGEFAQLAEQLKRNLEKLNNGEPYVPLDELVEYDTLTVQVAHQVPSGQFMERNYQCKAVDTGWTLKFLGKGNALLTDVDGSVVKLPAERVLRVFQ